MKFIVFSKKWGHNNIYGIKITKTGWYVKYASISGDCNDRGEPYLFDIMDRDYIDYPEPLGDYFAYLWEMAQGKDQKWIQERLNELSRWLMTDVQFKLDDDFWKKSNIRV